MKWCIIANDAPFLVEFFGKLSTHFLEEGDECVAVFTGKIAEYEKEKHFPENVRRISKVEWFKEQYDSAREDYEDITWRPLFANFDRMVRWPWGYEDSVRRLSQEYQFFEHLFQTEHPDAILFETPSGVAAQVAYHLSLKHGIPYLGITDSRIAGRLEVQDSEYTDKRFKQTFDSLASENILEAERNFAGRFIKDFLSHKQLPSYYGTGRVRFTPFEYVSHYMSRLREVREPLQRYLHVRKRFKDIDFESEARLKVMMKAPWEVGLRQMRIALQKHFYRRVDVEDQFYLFPLHTQPEASTSVQAMQYSDQAWTIRNIAFQLPFPSKLYVKEHPSAVGNKPDSFYQKIQNVPNVVLIAPEEKMQELILRSQGIITLTGTTGMEAALMGKPTYVLGNVFYEYHPLCRTPKTMDELRKQLLADRKSRLPTENLNQENIRFVVSYLRNTIAGSVPAAVAEEDPNDYQQIAQDLRRIAQARIV